MCINHCCRDVYLLESTWTVWRSSTPSDDGGKLRPKLWQPIAFWYANRINRTFRGILQLFMDLMTKVRLASTGAKLLIMGQHYNHGEIDAVHFLSFNGLPGPRQGRSRLRLKACKVGSQEAKGRKVPLTAWPGTRRLYTSGTAERREPASAG